MYIMNLTVGDIILFNFDGPIGKWKHAGIVASDPYRKSIFSKLIYFKVAECYWEGTNIIERCVYPEDFTFNNDIELFERSILYNKDKEYVKECKSQIKNYKEAQKIIDMSKAKIIRWKGSYKYIYNVISTIIEWNGNINYVTKFRKFLLTLLPSQSKDKEKYKLLVRDYIEDNKKEMFCSEYVAAIWIKALYENIDLAHKAIPFIPYRCTPSYLENLTKISPEHWTEFEISRLK